MKKTLLHLFLLVSLVTCSLNSWSQKISTVRTASAGYAKQVSSAESALAQLVHAQFLRENAATVVDFTQTQSATQRESLKSFFKTSGTISINNLSAFSKMLKDYPEALTLIIPYKGTTLTIDLVHSDIFTPDFKWYTDKQPEGMPGSQLALYKGIVRGQKSVASISFFEGKMEGYISIDRQSPIEISKLHGSNPGNDHLIYNDADVLQKKLNQTCTELAPPATTLMQNMAGGNTDKTAVSYKCVTNFWEAAYSVYQYFGSANAVKDFMTSLFNTYATEYSGEHIGMKIKGGYIWTSQDPYNNSLSTFSSLRTNFNANLAMLLSNAGGGGVAWLNTLCDAGDTYRHSFCGSIQLYEKVLPVTSYSWPVMVACHEVGHNLGSPHTHACAWNGNNTAIDGCGPAAGYSEGCSGPIPSNGGTIMSYCHLLTTGINLTKGFGPQPGDLIRGVINSCISLSCPAVGTTCLAPTNVTAKGITAHAATISWKAVAGASYYYIYISSDNGASFTLAANYLYGTSYRLTGLLANTAYICDVWVACANGGFQSKRITFNTTAGLQEADAVSASAAFTVSPNPVTGNSFTVSLPVGSEKALVEIINSYQQVVGTSTANGLLRRFTAPAVKGLYYIRVSSNGASTMEKLLIQ